MAAPHPDPVGAHVADAWFLGHVLDRLRELPDGSIHTSVTSPPYFGLRDYGTDPQDWPEVTFAPMPGLPPMTIPAMRCSLGNEPDPWAFVGHMVLVFREVRRVLRPDGTLWLNFGDSYAANRPYQVPSTKGGPKHGPAQAAGGSASEVPEGLKPKDLLGIPWRVAFALQADGWFLRMDNIWHKPNPMPESVTDRPTKAHEYVFLLSKSARYFYDAPAVAEEGTGLPPGNKSHKGATAYAAGDEKMRTKVGLAEIKASDTRNRRSVWSITPQPFGMVQTVRRVRVERDAACDGKMRTTSPGCPLHGDQPAPAASAHGGGRAADDASRTDRNEVRPAAAPSRESGSIDPSREPGCGGGSSGFARPSSSPPATPRSTGTSRTAHAPGSTSPCTPSAQTTPSTDDTSASRGSDAPDQSTPSSRTAGDDSGDDSWTGTQCRSTHNGTQPDLLALNASCTCEYYTEQTEKATHFATMPPALAEVAIRAGTSEHGCCATCGAPWERVVERVPSSAPERDTDTTKLEQTQTGGRTRKTANHESTLVRGANVTTGWRPTCAHGGEPVPCAVLDPFGGAGTTAMVARRLRRSFVYIELNPAYREIAWRRFEADAPLFNRVAS